MLPTLIILTAIFAAPMRAQDALPDAEGKPVPLPPKYDSGIVTPAM